MRLLSKKEVRALISLSFATIDRMENAKLFPNRVRLGQNRVAWIESEVLDWIAARIAERDVQHSS